MKASASLANGVPAVEGQYLLKHTYLNNYQSGIKGGNKKLHIVILVTYKSAPVTQIMDYFCSENFCIYFI